MNKNLEKLKFFLTNDGYALEKNWYIDTYNDICIKFNKKSITLKSSKGVQLIYANPNKINETDLMAIIQDSWV